MKKLAISLYAMIVAVLMIWGFYQAIYVAPDDAMQGYISRIIYYHVPSASLSFLFFAVSLVGSIGYLAFRRAIPNGRRHLTPGRWRERKWGWCTARCA